VLELAPGEGAAHVDDPLVAIDVALLECDPFRRPQPGRRREQDHRPVPWPDRRGDRFQLPPRLERMLLLSASRRVVDADLRGIDVDHSPGDRSLQHLPERLGRLEAVPGRERHPPLGDLLWGQLTDAPVTGHRGRLAQQIAQLLDRHRLDVVLRQVCLDQLVERQSPRDARLPSEPLELALERVTRVGLRGVPAPLNTLGVTAASSVAIRP
jgi:hypothetical protein